MSDPIREDPDQNPVDEDCWDRGCDGYACERCPFMPPAEEEEKEA